MAQQDNNTRANSSDDAKVVDKAGKPGEDRTNGDKAAPQAQGDKADTKQTAK